MHRRWLDLVLEITTIADEASSLDSALLSALEALCERFECDAGYCFERERGPELIRELRGGDLETSGTRIEEVARAWAERVMASGKTEIFDTLADEVDSLPVFLSDLSEVGGGLATTLSAGSRPLGAMVLFSRRPLSASFGGGGFSAYLDVIESIGTQLGRVIERWHLLRRITEHAEREREALGREIHDGLAQQLVGVRMLAQNLNRRTESEGGDAEKWRVLLEELSRAEAQARALARGLSVGDFGSHGDSLIEQLEALRELVAAGNQVDCALDVEGSPRLHTSFERGQLLQIAREAIFNAVRHAEATRIEIVLRVDADDEVVTLEIRDDGVGLPETDPVNPGLGIANMRYRAGLIGARLEFGSNEGVGTLVRCALEAGSTENAPES